MTAEGVVSWLLLIPILPAVGPFSGVYLKANGENIEWCRGHGCLGWSWLSVSEDDVVDDELGGENAVSLCRR